MTEFEKLLTDLYDTPNNTRSEKYDNLMRLSRRGPDLAKVMGWKLKDGDWAYEAMPHELFRHIRTNVAKFNSAERIELYGAYLTSYAAAEELADRFRVMRNVGKRGSVPRQEKDCEVHNGGQQAVDDVDRGLMREQNFSRRAVKVLGALLRREIYPDVDVPPTEYTLRQTYQRAQSVFRAVRAQFFPAVVLTPNHLSPLLPVAPRPNRPVADFGYIYRDGGRVDPR